MKDQSKYFRENDSLEQLERKTRVYLEQKAEDELRSKWEKELSDNHNLLRSQKSTKNKSIIRYLVWGTGIAASLLIGILMLTNTWDNNQISNPSELVSQILLEEQFDHPGERKGTEEIELLRQEAINHYLNGKYPNAIEKWEQLSNEKQAAEEDQFFLALSYLYDNQPQKTINILTDENLDFTKFREESVWFLGLAYILNKQQDEAKKVLNSIQPIQWKYEKAQEMLKLFKD